MILIKVMVTSENCRVTHWLLFTAWLRTKHSCLLMAWFTPGGFVAPRPRRTVWTPHKAHSSHGWTNPEYLQYKIQSSFPHLFILCISPSGRKEETLFPWYHSAYGGPVFLPITKNDTSASVWCCLRFTTARLWQRDGRLMQNRETCTEVKYWDTLTSGKKRLRKRAQTFRKENYFFWWRISWSHLWHFILLLKKIVFSFTTTLLPSSTSALKN